MAPHSKKALLHAELQRDRCAELVLLLGFVIVAAFMIIVLAFLFDRAPQRQEKNLLLNAGVLQDR